jgi:putative selenate reductase YgfK subunit
VDKTGKGDYSVKIKGFDVSDETMHVQIVEGEALRLLTSKTGTWRSVRPLLLESIAPCIHACPGRIRIREYLALLEEGELNEAAALLAEDNPLAAITGRVCPCFCEPDCNRGEFDQPIAIKSLERLLGDYTLKQGFPRSNLPTKKERVAIIGSGPAGLSAAYFLAMYGYKVTIFEALAVAGGMLHWGIPEYRLPKKVVAEEIEAIKSLGVEIKTNVAVGKNITLNKLLTEGYNAALVAAGAWSDLKLNIPGEDVEGVIPGIDFLKQANAGEKVKIGDKVCVIGGGNTAIDSARTASRLGARQVSILYRRSRTEMPAVAEEVEAALKEGIEIQFLVAPTEILAKNGKVSGIQCLRMELGEPDEGGRRRPIPIKGSEFNVDADAVIAAIGQVPDLTFLTGSGVKIARDGTISANADTLVTNMPKIFVAGDAQSGPATVIQAIASGRKAASGINAWLSGSEALISPKDERVVKYEDLNVNYFEHKPRQELEGTVLEALRDAAITEALRCFHCGSCNQCNTCWFLCPDGVVRSKDEKVDFDYDYCKGCGVCAEECPRGAIMLEEESKWQ